MSRDKLAEEVESRNRVFAERDALAAEVVQLRAVVETVAKASGKIDLHSYGCATRNQWEQPKPSVGDIDYPEPVYVGPKKCDCWWEACCDSINAALSSPSTAAAWLDDKLAEARRAALEEAAEWVRAQYPDSDWTRVDFARGLLALAQADGEVTR